MEIQQYTRSTRATWSWDWDDISVQLESNNMPADILIDILSRLPVKSMVRFTCVHKSWYGLVKHPTFVALHFIQPSRENKGHFHDLRHAMEYNTVVGCSLGIFCYKRCLTRTLCLYNPAIKELKEIQLPEKMSRKNNYAYSLYCSGFGFDSRNHECKFVQIEFRFKEKKCEEVSCKVHVYALNFESWNTSYFTMDRFVHVDYTSSALVNDTLHWKVIENEEDDSMSNFLLSLDLVNEKPVMIMLPKFSHYGHKNWEIFVFEECLAIIVTYGEEGKNFDVWMMKEYGVLESWAKCYSIQSCFTIGKLMQCSKRAILFTGNWDEDNDARSWVLRFDSDSLETVQIRFEHVEGVKVHRKVFNYKESLGIFGKGRNVADLSQVEKRWDISPTWRVEVDHMQDDSCIYWLVGICAFLVLFLVIISGGAPASLNSERTYAYMDTGDAF